jgi:hypothetical protein
MQAKNQKQTILNKTSTNNNLIMNTLAKAKKSSKSRCYKNKMYKPEIMNYEL